MIGSGLAEMTNTLAVLKAQSIIRQYINELYLSKCIDYFFMIKKHWPLTDNYGEFGKGNTRTNHKTVS